MTVPAAYQPEGMTREEFLSTAPSEELEDLLLHRRMLSACCQNITVNCWTFKGSFYYYNINQYASEEQQYTLLNVKVSIVYVVYCIQII